MNHKLNIHNSPILLASGSPRRKELLEAAGFEISVRPTQVPEDYPATLPLEQVAAFLADKKAEAARKWLRPGTIVLAADSTVIADDRLLEKPADVEEATDMLSRLSGRTHQVITGVCLLNGHHKEVFSECTEVSMAKLSDEEIQYYVQHFRPFDKAGAYGIQEWIGLCKVERIEGSYSNVVGLPMARVYAELEAFVG